MTKLKPLWAGTSWCRCGACCSGEDQESGLVFVRSGTAAACVGLDLGARNKLSMLLGRQLDAESDGSWSKSRAKNTVVPVQSCVVCLSKRPS